MIDNLLNLIKAYYPLKENDAGSFKSFDVNGMNINVFYYDAENLGNVSIIKGGNQMMSMDSLIISPFYKDITLFSYDRIKAFGNDTIWLELFDVTLNKNTNASLINNLNDVLSKYEDIKNEEHHSNWYDSILLPTSINKKGNNEISSRFDDLEEEYLSEYLKDSLKALICEETLKKDKCKEYCDGLLNNGGPSTDVFKKAKGEEFTKELFHKVLFNV